MRVGIVGCGLIGVRRAGIALEQGDRVAIVADTDIDRARRLAYQVGAAPSTDWRAVTGGDVDAVVVATSNDWLAAVTIDALAHGKHVIVEKPMARNLAEAQAVIAAWERDSTRILKVGFNHRLHPAVLRAHELFSRGEIGDVMFIRGRYGHGGRPGYEREWRANRELSGGGELLDQGVHLIDLFNWFVPDLHEAIGCTADYVWKPAPEHAATAVEDNAFGIFRGARGQTALMHVSWTQWKNIFSLEVFGHAGYLLMEGLGGSYGAERLTVGHRRFEGGAPSEDVIEFPGSDGSWLIEWREFRHAIETGTQPRGNGRDGLRAMALIDALYRSSSTGLAVKVV